MLHQLASIPLQQAAMAVLGAMEPPPAALAATVVMQVPAAIAVLQLVAMAETAAFRMVRAVMAERQQPTVLARPRRTDHPASRDLHSSLRLTSWLPMLATAATVAMVAATVWAELAASAALAD